MHLKCNKLCCISLTNRTIESKRSFFKLNFLLNNKQHNKNAIKTETCNHRSRSAPHVPPNSKTSVIPYAHLMILTGKRILQNARARCVHLSFIIQFPFLCIQKCTCANAGTTSIHLTYFFQSFAQYYTHVHAYTHSYLQMHTHTHKYTTA